MQDVAKWLEGLGLGKYAALFAQHEIDFAALPHLTDGMLAELGLPVGPRAKLLAAIAALRAVPLDEVGTRRSETTGADRTEPQREAERRQITVLFSDLVDSTKLAARLDPEDLRALMQDYQRACGAAIEHYGGHIAQYVGDGIVAYFGWPVAREDAAERAVRAGLDIVEAVKAIKGPLALTVRVGVSTGIVVISETGLGDPSIPAGAIGETPHIAARLQALAEPNSVVISSSTSRLVEPLCVLEDLGPQTLKGLAEPMHAFRAKRMHTSRFLAARVLTPLVGRQAELALLRQRWTDAREGEGQLVYVSGLPGIGKSRIVHELERGIGVEARFRLKFQCVPHHVQSPLYPIVHGLEWQARLGAEDTREAKLEKIRYLLTLSTPHIDRTLPLFAELFSIPIEPGEARRALTAQQAKDQTLYLLADLLSGLSAHGPVLCLLEDAQWIDPSTQELLTMLAGRIEKARILFIVTHRPDYQPQLGDHGNVSTLAIARLSRRDMAEMARLVLQTQAISNGLIKRIIDDSDAIPLFVEELARGVVDADGAAAPRVVDEAVEPPGEAIGVPASLRDSLMARLDRAPQGRRVAQIASVIGREFPYDTLAEVSRLDPDALEATLAHLVRSEIVQQTDREPSARFAFTHALLRDVAYESLLKSARRDIHARVADAIRKGSPDVVIAQPELLAYHYGQAGNVELAVQYWLAGGRRARSRWAHLEAIGQLQRALELLETLPATPARAATELEIRLSLGLSCIAVRGYSSDDTRRAFERACELSAQGEDAQLALRAHFGLWGHYWMTARHDRALELAATLLSKAEEQGDRTARVVGHRAIGSTLFTLGEFVRAREHLERAIALAQQQESAAAGTSFAVDPRVAAQLLLGWDLWVLGYPDRALANVLQALDRATRIEDPYSGAFAHYVSSAVHLLRGEADDALEHASRSLAISTEHRINLYALYSQFGRGCALALRGQVEEAIGEIRAGIDGARRSNLGYMRGFMAGWLACAQTRAGEPQAALSAIDEALREHVSDIAGRAWEAELRRLRGEVLFALGEPGPAAQERDPEPSYHEAIAVARRQQARSLELRAATSLAKLCQARGRRDEARALLAPVYTWFTEGFDTADLKDAKALLEGLQ